VVKRHACKSILLKKVTHTRKVKELGKGKWKRVEVSCDKEIEKKKIFFLNDNQEIVPFFLGGPVIRILVSSHWLL